MDHVNVLIVEDDPRISEIHRRFTEKVEGFRAVGVANSLAEARELIAVLEPDLILLDIYFPAGSGIDLLWDTRARFRKIDFILITAAKEVQSLQEAIRGGAFDYIIKPAVFARFREALERYRQTRHKLAAAADLEQRDVDELLSLGREAGAERETLPKGIDAITLAKVRSVYAGSHPEGLSAEEVGHLVGTSRSTSRRYLEYLVEMGWLAADLVYGTVGRPERRYFRL
jgi:two-component system CitB family response regulator